MKLLFLLSLLTTVACKKASAITPAALPAWSTMTFEQRQDHMGLVVLPKMKGLFQQFNSAEFADFRCQTCHGDGFDKAPINFKMPNSLPPLNPADPITQNLQDHPETTRFMMEKVVPEMAGLLGTKPYDPGSNTGFGCFGCHPKAGTP